jgi:hypothetical protein
MSETPESIADALTEVMAAATAEAEPETETAPDSISEEAVTEDVEDTQIGDEDTQIGDVEASEEDNDESEEPETVFQAPEHWSSDERTQFESLPPEAQEVLLERDKAFQKGYQEKAQAISAITEAIKPWEQALAQKGVTADQAIRTLLAAQHQLDTNPVQGILQIAQSYGIVDQLKNQFAPQTDDDDFTDPGIKALQQEILSLKSEIAQTKQGVQQQVIDSGTQQLEIFKSATDDKGAPLHPHFDAVLPLVTTYVQQGKTLEDAYQAAVWTVPEFRESQIKPPEKTEQEKAQKVKKAKRAARAVKTNGKDDPDAGAEARSIKEDLAEAFRQHSS